MSTDGQGPRMTRLKIEISVPDSHAEAVIHFLPLYEP